MNPDSWRHSVTRYQWLVLFIAWLGWVFDSMDSTICAMILKPALQDLMRGPGGGAVPAEAIGWYGGINLLDLSLWLGHLWIGVRRLSGSFRAGQGAGFYVSARSRN